MDDADARAVADALLRAAFWSLLFWATIFTAPLLFDGVSKGDAAFSAAVALTFVALLHFMRLAWMRVRVPQSGPWTGLRPAQRAEVMAAVRGGRAVSDPMLAGPAAAWARRRLRRESIGRIGLPVIAVLRLVTSFTDVQERHAPVAYRVVVVAPLVVFWTLDLVG